MRSATKPRSGRYQGTGEGQWDGVAETTWASSNLFYLGEEVSIQVGVPHGMHLVSVEHDMRYRSAHASQRLAHRRENAEKYGSAER